MFLARRSRLSPFYQTIYFLPVITPMVPMAIAWKWIYDYNYGILNYLLSLVGPARRAVADRSSHRAVGAHHHDVWKHARLQPDPVPGRASATSRTNTSRPPASTAPPPGSASGCITLPLLRPILLYVLVTATINAFNVFTQVYVMTLGSQSAPGQAVRVLVFDIYQNAFQYPAYGLRLGRGRHAHLDRARASR